MFKPSQLHHRTCRQSCRLHVPYEFGILCWNVYKNNTKHHHFKKYLQVHEEKTDFMLFQEAHFKDNTAFTLPEYSFDAAANLEVRGEFYGVLSASKTQAKDAQAYLSEGRESLVGPHKSLLVSSYGFEDGSTLLIVNVHAINFRENRRYSKELERFLALLRLYKGALIIAGDFNTWNKRRMQKLASAIENLGLKAVPFKSEHKVKSFWGNHLDFIFYRDIDLLDYSVDADHCLSDHNPLFALFRKKS